MADQEWISPAEVSEQYGIQIDTLKDWRKKGYGPPWARFGRLVRYRQTDWTAYAALEAMKARSQ